MKIVQCMSRERLVVDFKLARFTRLLAGPAEMTKGSKGETATAETAKATQASRNLMKNFLKAAATPTVKRGRDDWAASPRPDQAAKKAL
jgi:hypothetical protein